MINISRLSLWLSATFAISNCQLLPLASYRHDIAFPSITGELRTTTSGNDQQPVLRQFSGGFHLNPPPPLPFLQSFPINPQFFSDARDSFRSGNVFPSRPRFLGPPLRNLFTPNIDARERPESEGQEEEYRKYLKEEAEDLEKESHENEITTDFTSFESTSLQPTQNTFVRLNIQGKDYSYST